LSSPVATVRGTVHQQITNIPFCIHRVMPQKGVTCEISLPLRAPSGEVISKTADDMTADSRRVR
jgi:hypothetical protein